MVHFSQAAVGDLHWWVCYSNFTSSFFAVEVAMTGDYMVSGAGLGSTAYKAVQFHFHWGQESTRGSEHTINGVAYPAEVGDGAD